MKTIVIKQEKVIEPFGRPAADLPFLVSTLGDHQREVLRALKLPAEEARPADANIDGPAFVYADDTIFTRRLLRDYLRLARASMEPTRVSLPASEFWKLYSPLQDVGLDDGGNPCFDIGYVPVGKSCTASELFTSAQTLTPKYRELQVDVRMPRYILGIEKSNITVPMTSSVAMRIRHWVHVQRAGMLFPQIRLLEKITSSPMQSLLRLLLSLRGSRKNTLETLKSRLVWKGKNTFIHPSATVEASFIGNNVYIGPHALVVQSVIGDDVHIEERAHIAHSTVGHRTTISKNSVLSSSVTFGDTDACANGLQGCVVAERCGLTSFVRPLDIAPGREVHVRDAETLRSVGSLPCGVCFGEGVFAGAGVYIAPGRVVPPGLRLLGHPEQIFKSFDAAEAGSVGYAQEGGFTSMKSRPREGQEWRESTYESSKSN